MYNLLVPINNMPSRKNFIMLTFLPFLHFLNNRTEFKVLPCKQTYQKAEKEIKINKIAKDPEKLCQPFIKKCYLLWIFLWKETCHTPLKSLSLSSSNSEVIEAMGNKDWFVQRMKSKKLVEKLKVELGILIPRG